MVQGQMCLIDAIGTCPEPLCSSTFELQFVCTCLTIWIARHFKGGSRVESLGIAMLYYFNLLFITIAFPPDARFL